MQSGPSHAFLPYFQSRCIGQISQCSWAVMIRTARRPEVEHARPADERDVVEVDDVDVDRVEGLAEDLRLEVGLAGHLRGQRREDAEAALERVDVQTRRRRIRPERVRPLTELKASTQWKTWTSCPRRQRARESRSTYAASPPKLWAPKNVVTMQNFNGDLLSRPLSRRITGRSNRSEPIVPVELGGAIPASLPETRLTIALRSDSNYESDVAACWSIEVFELAIRSMRDRVSREGPDPIGPARSSVRPGSMLSSTRPSRYLAEDRTDRDRSVRPG